MHMRSHSHARTHTHTHTHTHAHKHTLTHTGTSGQGDWSFWKKLGFQGGFEGNDRGWKGENWLPMVEMNPHHLVWIAMSLHGHNAVALAKWATATTNWRYSKCQMDFQIRFLLPPLFSWLDYHVWQSQDVLYSMAHETWTKGSKKDPLHSAAWLAAISLGFRLNLFVGLLNLDEKHSLLIST